MNIKELMSRPADGSKVTVHGWVRTKRDTKNVCFFEINDGSTLKSLQAVIDKTGGGEESIPDGGSGTHGGGLSGGDAREGNSSSVDARADEIDRIATGASVEASGTLAESPGKGQQLELQVETFRVIGESPPERYPLQKKRHSFEYLREIAHLRPRTNTFGAVTRVRNAMSFAIHRFFQENGFLYVHTPIISTSDAEGAGDMFRVTTLPLDELAKRGEDVDYAEDFFGKSAWLTVSGQLEAEVYALAFKNVYTFGPTFRAENSNTSRHLAEFWMIEPEMAFCDLTCDMDTAEAFLKYVLGYVLEHCTEDMDFFDKWIEKGILANIRSVAEAKFARMTYSEAIDELSKASVDFEYPTTWGTDLQSEHEKYLTEHICKGPVIVTDYPKEIKAFYMKRNDDGKTVRAMDVLVPRLGEIIGGSQREDDHDALYARISEVGLNPDDYWWYLELRTYGSAPHSGFGLGFERLIQYVTGMQNIRDVIPFPRAVHTADF